MRPSNFRFASVSLILSFFVGTGVCRSLPQLRELGFHDDILGKLAQRMKWNNNTIHRMGCTSKLESKSGVMSYAMAPSDRRWKAFVVYVDPSYGLGDRMLINEAMHILNVAVPGLPFLMYIPGAIPSGNYVHIKKSSGCWSTVGMTTGVQELSLASPGCMTLDIIVHELIHALGFWHEQSRWDRDDFVTIMWKNIEAGKEHAFKKVDETSFPSYGISYNTKSIMHYRGDAFSSNGQPTIVSKDGGDVGCTGGLQLTDIEKLQKMYSLEDAGPRLKYALGLVAAGVGLTMIFCRRVQLK